MNHRGIYVFGTGSDVRCRVRDGDGIRVLSSGGGVTSDVAH